MAYLSKSEPRGRRAARHQGLDQLQVNMLSGPLMRGLNVAIVLFSYPAYLHALGFERYGLWLVLSTVLMLSQLGNLGIVQGLAKVVAEEYAVGDTLAVRQYSTAAALALVVCGVFAFSATFFLRGAIVRLLGLSGANAGLAWQLLPWCGALSAYVFLSDAQTNVLGGLGRMDLVNALQTLSQAVSVAAGVYLLHCGAGVAGLLAAAMASRLLQHGAALFLIARLLRAPVFTLAPISRARLRRLASLCSGLVASTTVSLLLTPFNRLVIARCVGIQAVPVYEIAYNGAMQIRSLLCAGSSALLPEISRLRAGSSAAVAGRAISRLTRSAARLLVVFGLPLYTAVFVVSRPLLRLWLHGGLHAGQADAFQIMLAGSFASLLGTVPYYSLLGLHRSRPVLYSHLVQSSVNIVGIGAVWIWMSSVQLWAVLLATSAGMAASTVYLAWASRQAIAAIAPRRRAPAPLTRLAPTENS
jgi:O-antigen/teichoic acid export membrane protein